MQRVICGLVLCGWMSGLAFAADPTDLPAEPDLATAAAKTAPPDEAPAAPASAPTTPFTITTTGFLDQGVLPVLYTCDGKNISPEFAWTNPPKGTKAFAMIYSDPNAPKGTWYHWVVYNLPATTTELTEGVTDLPKGSVIGENSWNNKKYEGPCPPKGSVHTYIFTLYALSEPVKEVKSTEALVKVLEKQSLGKVTQTAVYSRWKS